MTSFDEIIRLLTDVTGLFLQKRDPDNKLLGRVRKIKFMVSRLE